MGRNHHLSIYKYVRIHNAEYFIQRVEWFIHFNMQDVVAYARIRSGLVYHQNNIDRLLHFNKFKKIKSQYPALIIKRYKQQRKDLSIQLDKLDKYMQRQVNRNE